MSKSKASSEAIRLVLNQQRESKRIRGMHAVHAASEPEKVRYCTYHEVTHYEGHESGICTIVIRTTKGSQ